MKRAFILTGVALSVVVLLAAAGVWAAAMNLMGDGRMVSLALLAFVPAAVVAVQAALVLILAASSWLEERAMRPVWLAERRLRLILDGTYTTDAAYPISDSDVSGMWKLDNLLAELSDRLSESTRESERLESILDSMSEGLVVMDAHLRVLLINRSAAEFFGTGQGVCGRNLLHMIHVPGAVDAARHAAKYGRRETVDIRHGTRTMQLLASPVREGDAEGGVILLMTDVTAVRLAEKIRSDFVANASHELKTPLTAIKGFAELMQQGLIRDPDQLQHTVSLIVDETDRMIQLIGDILKLSELESEAANPGGPPVSLRLTAQKAAESLELQAKQRDVTVTVGGDDGTLHADPDRMTELLLNLMDNAVKYNRPGGRVDVTVAEEPGHVTLTVADTGVGIPPEAQERVFERFYRVDKGRSRRQGGTGLGLAIVKHIVGLYQGEIHLESQPGAGTTIRVILPTG